MPKIFLKFKSVFLLLAVFILFAAPNALAATEYKVEVGLPGAPATFSDPGAYIRILFIFGLSLAGFLAVGAIAWGGIQYMAAGTSLTSVQKAKDLIVGAISGIVLLLCSWLILATIDPTLTNLTPKIQPAGDVTEPPSPPDSGLTEGSIILSGVPDEFYIDPGLPAGVPAEKKEIKCKTNTICQSLQNGQTNNTLVQDLESLPISITVTETNGSHGCSAGDSCVSGAACGTSSHCSGRAADIRVSNLTSAQQQQVLQTLSQDKCVDQLFYSGFPQYCRAGGQPASQSKDCAAHSDHIHYSVKANCV